MDGKRVNLDAEPSAIQQSVVGGTGDSLGGYVTVRRGGAGGAGDLRTGNSRREKREGRGGDCQKRPVDRAKGIIQCQRRPR